MEHLKKILGYQLIILAVYTIISRIYDDNLAGIILLAILIATHTLTNFFISAVQLIDGRKDLFKTYLVSGILILLIGFSACSGVFSIF